MKTRRRARWLRARCNACRGALKVRQEDGEWVVKGVSCHCPAGSIKMRFSRPRKGGKRRK